MEFDFLYKFVHVIFPIAMKKIPLVALIVFLLCAHAEGQIVNPMLWLRADSAGSVSSVWQDLSGNGCDALFIADTAPTADSLLNYNPCFHFDGSATLLLPHLRSTVPVNDVIIVYQADTAVGAEMPLWVFQSDSTRPLGLTTRRILNGGSTIQYSEANARSTVVNSLSQLWHRDGMGDTLYFCGSIGGDDTSRYAGKIAEVVVLPCGEGFSDTAHTQWCSYLAIKYGVTLKDISYLSSNKGTVWPTDSLPEYSRQVIGLGRDDRFGLYQKQSAMQDGILGIGFGVLAETNILNESVIEDGSYLMVGCGENGFGRKTALYLDNGMSLERYGDGMVRVTGQDIPQKPTTVRVDAGHWGDSLQEYVLLVDRSAEGGYLPWSTEVFLPTAVDTVGKAIVFDGVHWDTDGNGQDIFCFARLTPEELQALLAQPDLRPKSGGVPDREDGGNGTNAGQYALYPNPNSGHFVLEAQYLGATPISVYVYTADGRTVRTYQRGADTSHRIEGSISAKGQYLIEIVSQEGRNLVKMVVQ